MNILAVGSSEFRTWSGSLNGYDGVQTSPANHGDDLYGLIAHNAFNCILVEFKGPNTPEAKTLNNLKRMKTNILIVGVVDQEMMGLRMKVIREGAEICLSRSGSTDDFVRSLRSMVPFLIRRKGGTLFSPCNQLVDEPPTEGSDKTGPAQ